MNDLITIQAQIQEWSKLYNRPISEKEFTEICANLSGFFTILKEWDEEERRNQENGNPSL